MQDRRQSLSDSERQTKIAIVDDDPNLRDVLSRAVAWLGYQNVSIFENGASFVGAFMQDKSSFDIVLMDYRMPEMDGMDAAKVIKRYAKDTRIVMMTGYDFVKERASSEGFDYLQKPFSTSVLAEKLGHKASL